MVGKETRGGFMNQIFNLIFLIIGVILGLCINNNKAKEIITSGMSYMSEDIEAEAPEE
jgi:hypothetical protein